MFALYLKLELHTKTWYWNLATRNNTFFSMFIKLPTWFLFQICDIKTLMIFSRNAVKLVEFTLTKKIPRTFVKKTYKIVREKKTLVGTFSTCEGNDEAIAHSRLHIRNVPPHMSLSLSLLSSRCKIHPLLKVHLHLVLWTLMLSPLTSCSPFWT